MSIFSLFRADHSLGNVLKLSFPVLERSKGDIERNINRVTHEMNSLLPCEEAARKNYNDLIADLKDALLSRHFRKIDKKILSWRRKDGFPSLAIYDVNQKNCYFKTTAGRMFGTISNETSIPFNLLSHYDDVFDRLISIGGSVQISAVMPGTIPVKIREKILGWTRTYRYNGQYFNKVLLIAEAPAWKVEKEVVPVNLDPIVVGMNERGTMWVLDTFDLTPLERIAVSEFTTGRSSS